ncbi:MAG: ComEC family competence protein [Bacteroidales bacterium]|nr:ComEC family competence protein [Bacteroidales bacterium]
MWSQVPLVRLIIPFITGIIISTETETVLFMQEYFLYGIAFMVIAGGLTYASVFGYSSRWVYGSFIVIFMFMCGYSLTEKKEAHGKKMSGAFKTDRRIYLARIDEIFVMREKSCRGLLSLLSYKDSSGWNSCSGKLMVYTEPDSSLPGISAGTILLIHAELRPVEPPKNPAEFDYRTYLQRKGIYHSTYLKKGQWHVTDRQTAFSIMHFAAKLRSALLDKLVLNGIQGGQLGVSAALLLGDDSHLSTDIRNVYAGAGAMHILCVSGLHVGVVYLVLYSMLGFLKRFRPGKYLVPVLLILSIWMYALITGLAAPVIRASCMISFLIVGSALSRHMNVYNTLAAAAMLMLLFDPYALFAAGFQLSYAAVLGIVSLQRPLYNLLYFRYGIPDKIWAITTVSIAAQLGTLPIVLYYFHQFPMYSLLTNLIVIPLSSFIIYAGFLLMFLPSLSYASSAAAWVLGTLLRLMDMGVSFVEGLPHSVIKDIFIDAVMAWLIYLIIISFSIFLFRKNIKILITGMAILLLFSAYRLFIHHKHAEQRMFIVYAVNKHSAYDIIDGTQHIFMTDSALLSDEGSLNYSIRPHWLQKGLAEDEIRILDTLHFDKKNRGKMLIVPLPWLRVAIWQGKLPACKPPDKRLKLDYLVLRGICPFEIEDLFLWFDPGMLILDTSVPWWKAERLKAQVAEKNVWIVRERGAFWRVRGRE